MTHLTVAERGALEDAAGCGCCSAKYEAAKVWPDACPDDDHEYNDGCVMMADVSDLVERILEARLAPIRALAEEWADDGARTWVANCGDDLLDALRGPA